MKNVLVLLTDSPVGHCGGLGIRMKNILGRLEDKFKFTVYCFGSGGTIGKDIKCIGVPNQIKPFSGIESSAAFESFVFDSIKQDRFDIVIGTDHQMVLPAKNICASTGAKFVIDINLAIFGLLNGMSAQQLREISEDKYASQMQGNVLWLEKMGIEKADQVITCSDFYAKTIPWKMKSPAISVQNGIDFNEFQDVPSDYIFEGGFKNNYVFLGRFNQQKGVQYLTDYFYDIKSGELKDFNGPLKLDDDSCLHFVGGPIAGDQWKAVEKTCNGNPQKRHIPFITGIDKIRLIKSATALILPSIHEPFGIAMMEALAAGTPLITTCVDGMNDFLDCANHIKCDKSVVGIEKSISTLNDMSERDLGIMTDNGLMTAQRFTWDDMACRFGTAIDL